MVFIQLDNGNFKEFEAPCVLTVGRGDANVLQPESQSVSKSHAVINVSSGRSGVEGEAFIEDLNSRNGTFIGPAPLDLSRVPKGSKAKLSFGDYIRFGHSQKFFRILDKLPPTNAPIQIDEEEEDELKVLPQYPTEAVGRQEEDNIAVEHAKFDEYGFELVPTGFLSQKIPSQSPTGEIMLSSHHSAIPLLDNIDDRVIPRTRIKAAQVSIGTPSLQISNIIDVLSEGRSKGRPLSIIEAQSSVALLSECLAESLNENFAASSVGLLNRTFMDLNELLVQCLRGSQIDSSSHLKASQDLESVLTEVIAGMIDSCLSYLQALVKTGLVNALAKAEAGEEANLAFDGIQDCIADAKSLLAFVSKDLSVSYLWKSLEANEVYEVISIMLLQLARKLDFSSEFIWNLKAASETVTKDYVQQLTHPKSAFLNLNSESSHDLAGEHSTNLLNEKDLKRQAAALEKVLSMKDGDFPSNRLEQVLQRIATTLKHSIAVENNNSSELVKQELQQKFTTLKNALSRMDHETPSALLREDLERKCAALTEVLSLEESIPTALLNTKLHEKSANLQDILSVEDQKGSSAPQKRALQKKESGRKDAPLKEGRSMGTPLPVLHREELQRKVAAIEEILDMEGDNAPSALLKQNLQRKAVALKQTLANEDRLAVGPSSTPLQKELERKAAAMIKVLNMGGSNALPPLLKQELQRKFAALSEVLENGLNDVHDGSVLLDNDLRGKVTALQEVLSIQGENMLPALLRNELQQKADALKTALALNDKKCSSALLNKDLQRQVAAMEVVLSMEGDNAPSASLKQELERKVEAMREALTIRRGHASSTSFEHQLATAETAFSNDSASAHSVLRRHEQPKATASKNALALNDSKDLSALLNQDLHRQVEALEEVLSMEGEKALSAPLRQELEQRAEVLKETLALKGDYTSSSIIGKDLQRQVEALEDILAMEGDNAPSASIRQKLHRKVAALRGALEFNGDDASSSLIGRDLHQQAAALEKFLDMKGGNTSSAPLRQELHRKVDKVATLNAAIADGNTTEIMHEQAVAMEELLSMEGDYAPSATLKQELRQKAVELKEALALKIRNSSIAMPDEDFKRKVSALEEVLSMEGESAPSAALKQELQQKVVALNKAQSLKYMNSTSAMAEGDLQRKVSALRVVLSMEGDYAPSDQLREELQQKYVALRKGLSTVNDNNNYSSAEEVQKMATTIEDTLSRNEGGTLRAQELRRKALKGVLTFEGNDAPSSKRDLEAQATALKEIISMEGDESALPASLKQELQQKVLALEAAISKENKASAFLRHDFRRENAALEQALEESAFSPSVTKDLQQMAEALQEVLTRNGDDAPPVLLKQELHKKLTALQEILSTKADKTQIDPLIKQDLRRNIAALEEVIFSEGSFAPSTLLKEELEKKLSSLREDLSIEENRASTAQLKQELRRKCVALKVVLSMKGEFAASAQLQQELRRKVVALEEALHPKDMRRQMAAMKQVLSMKGELAPSELMQQELLRKVAALEAANSVEESGKVSSRQLNEELHRKAVALQEVLAMEGDYAPSALLKEELQQKLAYLKEALTFGDDKVTLNSQMQDLHRNTTSWQDVLPLFNNDENSLSDELKGELRQEKIALKEALENEGGHFNDQSAPLIYEFQRKAKALNEILAFEENASKISSELLRQRKASALKGLLAMEDLTFPSAPLKHELQQTLKHVLMDQDTENSFLNVNSIKKETLQSQPADALARNKSIKPASDDPNQPESYFPSSRRSNLSELIRTELQDLENKLNHSLNYGDRNRDRSRHEVDIPKRASNSQSNVANNYFDEQRHLSTANSENELQAQNGNRADTSTLQKSPRTSLSVGLEELRRYKREAELQRHIERVRIQENAKDIRSLLIRRLCATFTGYYLRTSWRKWKSNVRNMTNLPSKRAEETMRAVRAIVRCCREKLRKVFIHWLKYSFSMRDKQPLRHKVEDSINLGRNHYPENEASTRDERDLEISDLKYQLTNLKASLHEITKEQELPALLSAERALVRELSAENLKLRASSQLLENKLLELADCPATKRRDVVHRFLVGKEDELIIAKQTIDTLNAELENIRQLATQRVEKLPPKERHSPLTKRERSSENRKKHNRHDKNEEDEDVVAVSDRMSQDAARNVILNEVRRLRDSHRAAEEAQKYLQAKMALENTRAANISMALSASQNRLLTLERSSAALRELLRQRLGNEGLLTLMDAMESMGAGAAALLEVPISESQPIADGNNQRYNEDVQNNGQNKNDMLLFKRGWREGNQKIPTDYTSAIEKALYY